MNCLIFITYFQVMELITCESRRKFEMESCSCVQVGMTCTEACFTKSCGNEEDPDQVVIYDAAGDAKSQSNSEHEDGDN